MKKCLSILSFFFLCTSLFSQPIDVVVFKSTTINQIIAKLGTPIEVDLCYYYPSDATLLYNDTGIYLLKSANESYILEGFETKSPNYCFLSDVVPGGIKVGDKLIDFKDIDFVHSIYGKGKADNGLKNDSEGTALLFNCGGEYYLSNYVIFEKEEYSYRLSITNGIVIAVGMFMSSE